MTNLLFIIHTGRLGGPAHSLRKLIKHFPVGYNSLIALPEEGEFSRILKNEGTPYCIFPFRYRNILALAKLIYDRRIDLVYGNNFSTYAYQALLAARIVRKPFIWHIREVFREDDPKTQNIYQRVRLADEIITVSNASAVSVCHFAPGKKIHVIHNGVDIGDFSYNRDDARLRLRSEFGMANNGIVIINIGAIGKRKNQKDAVEAMAGILQAHPCIFLLFVGNIEESQYAAELRSMIANLGIDKQVILTGFRKDAATLMFGADIMLHVAKWDPHPRVVLEAMTAGLPVVAYKVDGVVETVVADETGFLATYGDKLCLAAAVDKLILDPGMGKRMSILGRKRVEAIFTASHTSSEVTHVIESLLGRQK